MPPTSTDGEALAGSAGRSSRAGDRGGMNLETILGSDGRRRFRDSQPIRRVRFCAFVLDFVASRRGDPDAPYTFDAETERLLSDALQAWWRDMESRDRAICHELFVDYGEFASSETDAEQADEALHLLEGD